MQPTTDLPQTAADEHGFPVDYGITPDGRVVIAPTDRTGELGTDWHAFDGNGRKVDAADVESVDFWTTCYPQN